MNQAHSIPPLCASGLNSRQVRPVLDGLAILRACLVAVLCLVFVPACAPTLLGFHPPRLKPEQLAEYVPTEVKKVAIVEPREFTPTDEAAISIADPFTNSLIHTLRTRCRREVVPGHVMDPLRFVSQVRGWYRSEKKARFPAETFQQLTGARQADAYLVTWIDRSSREWLVNEKLEMIPGGQYRLELTYLLFDPQGRLLFSVVTEETRPAGRSGIGLTVREAVENSLTHLVRGFEGQENWQLGMF